MKPSEWQSECETIAEKLYYKDGPHRWPTGLQIEQVAAFVQGAKWMLLQAEINQMGIRGKPEKSAVLISVLKKLLEPNHDAR